jgi:hypothetical protein
MRDSKLQKLRFKSFNEGYVRRIFRQQSFKMSSTKVTLS